MSTYHGIAAVQCFECGYATTDDTEMELWNDLAGGDCLKCGVHRAEWTLDDGTIRTSTDEEVITVVNGEVTDVDTTSDFA
jgi:Zn ribbon nucleic-acid-binding protein